MTGRQVGRAPALAEKGMVSRLQLLGDEGLSPIPRTGAGDTRGQGTPGGRGPSVEVEEVGHAHAVDLRQPQRLQPSPDAPPEGKVPPELM